MSGSKSVVPYNAKQQRATRVPAINTSNDIEPILDFSFFRNPIEELIEVEPRESPRKGKVIEREDGKSQSNSLRLHSNGLPNLNKLMEFVTSKFENTAQLQWIDLSFNELTNIDPILDQFEKLQILYLHGNLIRDIDEVNKLQKVHTLKKLTLHGNPLENKTKGYRCAVLTILPHLESLDFSRVTKADKRTAQTWAIMKPGTKNKKKHQDDDD